MGSARILHNPRCSKSRQTLALLEEAGVEVEVVKYLEAPPTKAELEKLLKQLGLKATQIIRTKEKLFKVLQLKVDDDRSEAEWISLLVENPVLIERPIVSIDGRAVIGRPPENVKELL